MIKKISLIAIASLLCSSVWAKTVNCTAGNLSKLITQTERDTITYLTVTGTIDARDFKTMRDSIKSLVNINLYDAMILSYTGLQGTFGVNSNTYPSDEIPNNSFYEKLNIVSFIAPKTTTAIGIDAFYLCRNMTNLVLPECVKVFKLYSMSYLYGLTSFKFPASTTTLDDDAFYATMNVNVIDLPSSVTSIGKMAFWVTYVNTVYVRATKPPVLGTSAFPSYSVSVKVPSASLAAYKADAEWKKYNLSAYDDFSVSTTSITLPNTTPNNATLEIASSVGWTASSDVSWLHLSAASGSASYNMTVNADKNTGSVRTGTITFITTNSDMVVVSVLQDASVVNTLSASTSSLTLPSTASSNVSFNVYSNTSWTVKTSESWLSASKTSGYGASTITLTAEKNATNTSRTARITLSATGLSDVTIDVTQLKNITSEWVANTSAQQGDIAQVTTLDNTTAFSFGVSGTIMKSTDQGITWTKQTTPNSTVVVENGLFIDKTIGYAVCNNGSIWKSLDSGKTWSALSYKSNYVLYDMHFFNKDTGLIVGRSATLLRTTDGGATWTQIAVPNQTTSDWRDIIFINDTVGFVCGGSGSLAKTTDGGKSWSVISSGTSTYYLTSIQFTSSLIGYISAGNGKILKTIDGGNKWNFATSPTSSHLWPMHFFNDNEGYIGGGSAEVYKTTDGASTWVKQTVDSKFTGDFYGCAFFNSGVGLIVGVGGLARKETVELSKTVIEASNSSNNVSITVTTKESASWTASTNSSWITLSSTSGNATTNLLFVMPANSGADRTDSILVSSGNYKNYIVVNQKGGAVIATTLSASVSNLQLASEGGTESFNITSNAAWTINSSAAWLTVNKTSGVGSISDITVNATINSGTSERTATITISSSGISDVVITIVQSAYTDIEPVSAHNIQVTPNPSSDVVSIQSNASVESIVVCNLLGEVLLQNAASNSINIESLPQGLYLLKIYTPSGIATKRIIKH